MQVIIKLKVNTNAKVSLYVNKYHVMKTYTVLN